MALVHPRSQPGASRNGHRVPRRGPDQEATPSPNAGLTDPLPLPMSLGEPYLAERPRRSIILPHFVVDWRDRRQLDAGRVRDKCRRVVAGTTTPSSKTPDGSAYAGEQRSPSDCRSQDAGSFLATGQPRP